MTTAGPNALKNGFHKLYRTIVENPHFKDPTMWSVWLIPSFGIGSLRYLADKSRPQSDKLQRALEETIAYSVGTVLFFTLTPLAGLVVNRFTQNPKKISFITATFGTVVSTLYSGLWADGFAKKTVEKMTGRKSGIDVKSPLNVISRQSAITPLAVATSTQPAALTTSSSTPFRPIRLHPHYGHLAQPIRANP